MPTRTPRTGSTVLSQRASAGSRGPRLSTRIGGCVAHILAVLAVVYLVLMLAAIVLLGDEEVTIWTAAFVTAIVVLVIVAKVWFTRRWRRTVHVVAAQHDEVHSIVADFAASNEFLRPDSRPTVANQAWFQTLRPALGSRIAPMTVVGYDDGPDSTKIVVSSFPKRGDVDARLDLLEFIERTLDVARQRRPYRRPPEGACEADDRWTAGKTVLPGSDPMAMTRGQSGRDQTARSTRAAAWVLRLSVVLGAAFYAFAIVAAGVSADSGTQIAVGLAIFALVTSPLLLATKHRQ